MSGRVRILFWIALAVCLLWGDFQSRREGHTVFGSLVSGSTLELVSWDGRVAVIATFDAPYSGGWHHQRIPRTKDWIETLDSLLPYGFHFLDRTGAKGFLICCPFWSIWALLVGVTEGILFLRRRKHMVDATPDAGIAERHE